MFDPPSSVWPFLSCPLFLIAHMEKITILGMGHASVTQCYNTCFLLHSAKAMLLVDAGGGNGILSQLQKVQVSVNDVHHLFVTHAHTDHILGTIWLLRMVAQSKGYEGQLHVYAHSMAHKTGAAFADYGAHIIHGAANAMYLPKVIAFNAKDETAKKRYGEIADFMGLGGSSLDEKVGLLIKYLRGMNDDLKIPHCIKNYGADSYPTEQGFVPEEVFLERLPEIAANAILDACTGSNPRQPSQEEMEKLLKCCYYDTEVDF